jgi:hypothetical protein
VNGVDQLEIDSDENQSAARQRTDLLASADCHKWQTERNLGACLKQFIAVESLTGKNRYECERCCLPSNKKVGRRRVFRIQTFRYLNKLNPLCCYRKISRLPTNVFYNDILEHLYCCDSCERFAFSCVMRKAKKRAKRRPVGKSL